MKELLRLYPRSWRRRYGREMEVLLEETPGEIGVALDLVLGAAAAYAAVIRGNRILSAAGAFVNAICIAALLQAIAFVLFVMLARSSPGPKYLALGPIPLAQLWYPGLFGLGGVRTLPLLMSGLDWVLAPALFIVLVAALGVSLVTPRLARPAIASPARPREARRLAASRQRQPGRRGSPSRRGV